MQNNMDKVKESRRRRIAEEIADELNAQHLSRKEFAQMMHRSPSEVTKWLGGNHNFTSDLLAEISETLGTEISGCEFHAPAAVCGYSSLQEPASDFGMSIVLPSDLSLALYRKAKSEGMSAREYATTILVAALSRKEMSAQDFYGALGDEFPDAGELARMRTSNKSIEL